MIFMDGWLMCSFDLYSGRTGDRIPAGLIRAGDIME